MQYKKLNITEVDKSRKSLSGKPANTMATARQAAVAGVLVVQIHLVFISYTTLLPNCSLHGIHTLAALEFYAPHFFEMMGA